MSEIKKHIVRARRFEFGRVHHYRDAEVLYEKADVSDDCAAVALARLCIENGQFGLMKRRTDTLARLRRAAATSEPSFLRKLAIYIMYLDGEWNHGSINLMYLASQKDDYLAGYVMALLLRQSGDVIMKHLSLPIAERNSLYLDWLQRSARLGCLEASYELGDYYLTLGQVEEGLPILTRAAESGCFAAFQLLAKYCRSVGSDVCCADMEAFLSLAKRLACDMNDRLAAGYLADYLVDAERGTLADRVAAVRFHRKSFRRQSSKHTYVVFLDRRWNDKDVVIFAPWLLFLRNDYRLGSENSYFPVARSPKPSVD